MSSPLRNISTSNPSYVWTSISAARKLLLLEIKHKIYSRHEVKVWEDPWIPTSPCRPTRHVALVMHPNMSVSDLINQESNNWSDGLIEEYIDPRDRPYIRSLTISMAHRRDTFCWNYTKNGKYTVKSGYWIARNLLKAEKENETLEPSITKPRAFAWKIRAHKKICHLIWQLITGHVAFTKNLIWRNMRCDKYCPRCGEPEDFVTYASFECPTSLQAWYLSATPTSRDIFPLSRIYANVNYLFSRKNNIEEPELDRDPYSWKIWYILKARNDKLFRGIDKDPLELVRYAESECQAWFNANDKESSTTQDHSAEEPQFLSLRNICMIDGSWTPTSQFSGCGWAWMDSLGKFELMCTRNCNKRESVMHSELEALSWAMENMFQHSTCQRFGTNYKDLIDMIKESNAWPRFATELEKIETLKIWFLDFKITHVPRTQNRISDSLARTARSFHKALISLVVLFRSSYPNHL